MSAWVVRRAGDEVVDERQAVERVAGLNHVAAEEEEVVEVLREGRVAAELIVMRKVVLAAPDAEL
eukprot:3090356-Heterocapsa_arctica.AAC.1